MRKISLCLTNYNRKELLIESFAHVLNDERISEIVISDDHSDGDVCGYLIDYFKYHPKVKFFRNERNLGMSHNKLLSISRATNDWCIVFDSDNIIKPDYIDRLYAIENWDEDTIYHPDWAWVTFDFREWSGMTIDKDNVNNHLHKPMFDCLLNVCNYFVNKKRYVYNYVYLEGVKEADTIWHNYNHLKKGGKFYIVPDMSYFHRVHSGSGWMQNANENMGKAREIKELINKL
jgi:glycosyltransferase involved in cell wall biosynthesis